jgi:hypothetical protein
MAGLFIVYSSAIVTDLRDALCKHFSFAVCATVHWHDLPQGFVVATSKITLDRVCWVAKKTRIAYKDRLEVSGCEIWAELFCLAVCRC